MTTPFFGSDKQEFEDVTQSHICYNTHAYTVTEIDMLEHTCIHCHTDGTLLFGNNKHEFDGVTQSHICYNTHRYTYMYLL